MRYDLSRMNRAYNRNRREERKRRMDYDESLRYERIMDSMERCGIEKLDSAERVQMVRYLQALWLEGYHSGYKAGVEVGIWQKGYAIGAGVRNVRLRLRAVFARWTKKQN